MHAERTISTICMDMERRAAQRKRRLEDKNELFVALIHYPEKIRECIQAMPEGLAKLFKFRVPLDIGRECGLSDLDLCPTADENGERTYFTSPKRRNVSERSDIWNEVAVLVREHNNKCNLTPTESNTETVAAVQPSEPRPTPDERKMDQLIRKISSMEVNEVAKLLFDKEKEIGALQQQLSEEKNNSSTKRDATIKQLENANDLLMKELVTTGMSRKSLCSDDFYKSRPDLALHLYGLPWEQHKEVGDALFGTDDEDIDDLKENGWDVNVTGEGDMTPFEKYSICVMICKQGFKEETVAAFYGRDRSVISRYKDEWMPKLGAAGADMSELDLEMNHNIFDEEECQRLGVPYMRDGWPVGLLDFLTDDDPLKLEILAHEANT